MGNISFLTGTGSAGPLSIKESLHQFEDSSILFKNYWLKMPPDYQRASVVSAKAMEHLDHIVNEIMRARDTKMGKGVYADSEFETQLNINRGIMLAGVNRTQQQQMLDNGPGNGVLPSDGTPIKLETLLNKIKHRQHQSANFRFQNDKHIFVINVDKMNKTPDSIVEFDVLEFCKHCNDISSYM